MQIDDGGPAFPCFLPESRTEMVAIKAADYIPGMSLRAWFAGMVLGGQWEGRYPHDMRESSTVTDVVSTCYKLADAMLAELKKTIEPNAGAPRNPD